MSPHKPRRKFIYKGVKALQVIFVYTTDYAPAVGKLNTASKIEEITENGVKKLRVTYDGGTQTFNEADGKLAILW